MEDDLLVYEWASAQSDITIIEFYKKGEAKRKYFIISNGVVESQGCKSLLAAKLQLKQRQKWFELGEDKQEILW